MGTGNSCKFCGVAVSPWGRYDHDHWFVLSPPVNSPGNSERVLCIYCHRCQTCGHPHNPDTIATMRECPPSGMERPSEDDE